MQRRRQGFTTTFLMLIPMLGVPAMAIFGIPQFAPLVSSMTSHADEPELSGFQETRVESSATGSLRTMNVPAVEPVDLFRPYADESPSASPNGVARTETVQWSDPIRSAAQRTESRLAAPTPVEHREASVRASRRVHQQVYDIFTDDFREQPAAGSVTTPPVATPVRTQPVTSSTGLKAAPQHEGLTWRTAIDRLKACGSTSYRLTAGARDGEYRFVCFVTSPDDERITRRFEAESLEPLTAVEDVLAQIEGKRGQVRSNFEFR